MCMGETVVAYGYVDHASYYIAEVAVIFRQVPYFLLFYYIVGAFNTNAYILSLTIFIFLSLFDLLSPFLTIRIAQLALEM
jgi:hypothetical protein